MNFKEWPRVSEQQPPLKKCEANRRWSVPKKGYLDSNLLLQTKPWTQTCALPFSHFANNEAENLKIYNITVF